MKISKLMNRVPITCRIHDHLDRAAQLMWDHDIGCLPVIDDEGHIAGIVTDRDICMAAYTRGTDLKSIAVTIPMSKVVHCCRAEDDVEAVEEAMQEYRIRRMPVIDDAGHPIGMVSLNDIARGARRGKLDSAEVVATMAAVCEPRPMIVAPA